MIRIFTSNLRTYLGLFDCGLSGSIKNIVTRVNDFYDSFCLSEPKLLKLRRRSNSSPLMIVRALLGIIVTPRMLSPSRDLFIFLGSRNLYYVKEVSEVSGVSILVVGSSPYSLNAKNLNLAFFSAIHIEAAVKIASAYSQSLFLRFQLLIWSHFLSTFKNCIIISHEDTQPLGAFLPSFQGSLVSLEV